MFRVGFLKAGYPLHDFYNLFFKLEVPITLQRSSRVLKGKSRDLTILNILVESKSKLLIKFQLQLNCREFQSLPETGRKAYLCLCSFLVVTQSWTCHHVYNFMRTNWSYDQYCKRFSKPQIYRQTHINLPYLRT